MTHAVEHIPCDMTVTVDARATLAVLQTELAKGGQWLPIDPPSPDTVTVAQLLAHNLSGPRRFGYGTIRDYAIGMTLCMADGRTIKTGGKVVKNVAGYDLQKIFIGAKGALGTVVEATFKVRPRPQAEEFAQKRCATLPEAGAMIDKLLESPLTPVVLDLHNVNTNNFCVVLGFDGSKEEVAWQMTKARELGFLDQANLEYDGPFAAADKGPMQKLSVLPSKLIATIQERGLGKIVARAGNGIIYYHGEPPPRDAGLPIHLWKRAKETFDPNGLLAPLPS